MARTCRTRGTLIFIFLHGPMMHCRFHSLTFEIMLDTLILDPAVLLVFCLRLSIRYKAIVNPMDIQTSSAVFWTCLKAVSIWLLSVLLAIPEAVFSQVVSMQVKRFCPSLAWLILIGSLQRSREPSFFSPLRVTALTPPS